MGEIKDMISKQKAFYDNKEKNLVTKIWFYFRNKTLNAFRKNIGLEKEIYELHLNWLGDLSKKKVLDLGCYEGNSLSFYMAKNSKKYVGVDLSEKAIKILGKRLRGIPSAEVYSVDFLSSEFEEMDFDLIYAYGVLHHFKNTGEIIGKLKQKLRPEGKIISYDPLTTSLPIKLLRTFYRPFQTDREWEWPFSKKVYYRYSREFEILDRRAVLGRTKWLFMINLLPIGYDKKEKIGLKWHLKDWELSKYKDAEMFKCMHLTMLMQTKAR
ncbi:class I SAM-dependent methyltransferase [Christiangramia salexigens]|uniref:Methyltransferase n=1 Tax=Christiangramia salexigens TaxID=1913577 RepID=A0A1L3J4R9_9FLAO|nr:class I SAM-dependent methyltransferase [Christiangramia salexigens]APG60093.1 methyltransferase [Christiangramia salexigens]